MDSTTRQPKSNKQGSEVSISLTNHSNVDHTPPNRPGIKTMDRMSAEVDSGTDAAWRGVYQSLVSIHKLFAAIPDSVENALLGIHANTSEASDDSRYKVEWGD